MDIREIPKRFAITLSNVFSEWIEKNKKTLERKAGLLKNMIRENKKFVKKCRNGNVVTPPDVMGFAMWIFQNVCNFGVIASLSPNKADIREIPSYIDEKSTRKLLELCASTMSLQYLPRELFFKK